MSLELINHLKSIKDQWGQNTVKAIINKIDREGLQFNGTLRRSISYEQDKSLDGDISFNMADYGTFLDKGVNGTEQNVGSTYNYKGNYKAMAVHLKQWADSKGLNNYAVAHSIQKKGLKPRRFFDDIITKRVGDLGEEITEGMKDFMTKSMNDFNNKKT